MFTLYLKANVATPLMFVVTTPKQSRRSYLQCSFERRNLDAQHDELIVAREPLVAEQAFVQQVAGDAVLIRSIRFP